MGWIVGLEAFFRFTLAHLDDDGTDVRADVGVLAVVQWHEKIHHNLSRGDVFAVSAG